VPGPAQRESREVRDREQHTKYLKPIALVGITSSRHWHRARHAVPLRKSPARAARHRAAESHPNHRRERAETRMRGEKPRCRKGWFCSGRL